MMEISNTGAMNFFAQAAKAQGTAKATAAQSAAQLLPDQANVAATTKAGNSNFTPTEAVQKEAEKWESFADEILDDIESEMKIYNRLKNTPDSTWERLESLRGAEWVADEKQRYLRVMKHGENQIAYQQQLLEDNGFQVNGTIAQKNELGDYEFGDFEISKEGLGYELMFTGMNESSIEYSRVQGKGHSPKMSDDLQALLFKEAHS